MKEPQTPEEQGQVWTLVLSGKVLAIGAVFALFLVLAGSAAGVAGYRYWEQNARLADARKEMNSRFEREKVRVLTLLAEAKAEAAILQEKLGGALQAQQSSAISLQDLAIEQQVVAGNLDEVQKIFARLEDHEKEILRDHHLKSDEVLFSSAHQTVFGSMQQNWQELDKERLNLENLLQTVVAKRERLVAAEQKAVADAAAKKAALAKAAAQKKAAQQQQRSQAAAVYGGPVYRTYVPTSYYGGPVFSGGYYRRPYYWGGGYGGGYGYGPGWCGPGGSVGFGVTFR